MKTNLTRSSFLAAAILSLTAAFASAQSDATKPVGVTSLTDTDPGDFTGLSADTVACALVDRAEENGFTVDIDWGDGSISDALIKLLVRATR